MKISKIIRVAICQLDCHPALYIGGQAYLEEPFFHTHNTLSNLARNRFDVSTLQKSCLDTYLDWHINRITSILIFLEKFSPVPTLIVFPEYSIPVQCLPVLKDFTLRTGSTIFAGTHSFQNSPKTGSIYKQLGIRDDFIDSCRAQRSYAVGLLPIIVEGTVKKIISKQILSPFEKTEVSTIRPDENIPTIERVKIESKNLGIRILPLICSEALNKFKTDRTYEVVVIPSFTDKPKQFDDIINQEAKGKTIVIYCNDGKFGGSKIGVVKDNRSPDWWDNCSADGALPKGESILVADINRESLAVEVAVANPSRAMQLVSLASICYEQDQGGSCNVAKELQTIQGMQDTTVQAEELTKLLAKNPDALQAVRIDQLLHLSKQGTADTRWWECVGNDCIINTPGLAQIESSLASRCYSALINDITSPDDEKAGVAALQFIKECNRVSQYSELSISPTKSPSKDTSYIIDRDKDAEHILGFHDNPSQVVLLLSGLEQIGKTTVLDKALSQINYSQIKKISLQRQVTVDYIVYSIISDINPQLKPPYKNIAEMYSSSTFALALRKIKMILLEHAENLVHYHEWRNQEIADFISFLVSKASELKTKIVFESKRGLPYEAFSPAIFSRKHIAGLVNSFGVTHFNAQLRKMDQSTSCCSNRQKEKIVLILGGHPVAISLAANAVYGEGIQKVMALLKRRQGFYLDYIGSLLRGIDLSSEAQVLLKLLAGCRIPVPREAIISVCAFPAQPALRDLINLCLVEVCPDNNIRLAGILASYFNIEELPGDLKQKLHASVAQSLAQLFKQDSSRLAYCIEAEYHAALAGVQVDCASGVADGQIAIADQLYNDSEYEKAKAILDKLILVKKTIDILRFSALADAKCNSFDSALEKAKSVFRQNPKDTWLLSEISRIALYQSRDDIIDELVTVAKNACMEDESIALIEGRMFLRRKEYKNAIRAFKKARKLTKRNAWPFYFLGRAYLQKGDLRGAIETFQEGEEFYNENKLTNRNVIKALVVNLAIAHLLNKENVIAEGIITAYSQVHQKDPQAILVYAIIKTQQGNAEDAKRTFEKFARTNLDRRNKYLFHLFYGMFYLGIGELGQANEQFSRAHKADRNNVFVMLKWAKTLYDLAEAAWLEADDVATTYANNCLTISNKILEFDNDNTIALALKKKIQSKFDIF